MLSRVALYIVVLECQCQCNSVSMFTSPFEANFFVWNDCTIALYLFL